MPSGTILAWRVSVVTAMLAAATLVGVLSLPFGAGASGKSTQYISLVVNLNRGLDWLACCFSRHEKQYSGDYVPLSLASLYYVLNGVAARDGVNAAASAITGGCNAAWAIGLTAPGERKPGRGIGYRVAEDQLSADCGN